MSLQGWVWGALLGALISGAVLARAHFLNLQHRRSISELVRQAGKLDQVNSHLQAQLAQAQAFSGQAAHQLRTPLAALGLAIEELTLHPETPRGVRADLARCRNEVDRLADVISDLLALARRGALPSGQPTTDPAAVALHATRRWASSARAAGRELRVAGAMPDCQVRAPAGPASQVLDVLIDNALKHGAGDIEVSVDLLADSVRLRVADEGTPHREGARRTSSAGEGMGLALAEKLAAACGGQMVRAQQATTAFDLLLPRAGSGVGGDLAQEADDLSGEVHRRLA